MSKKASDILLELNGKVDSLAKTVSNLDNNMKIILQKLNKSLATTPSQAASSQVSEATKKPVPFDKLPQTNVFEQMKAEAGVVDRPEQAESQQQARRRGQRVKTTPGKRVIVSQEIQTQMGGPVFLANFEILTGEGDLVHQGRTNNKGKWSAPLDPGNYKINIIKRRKEGANIKASYSIEIPGDSKKLDLPPHVLV